VGTTRRDLIDCYRQAQAHNHHQCTMAAAWPPHLSLVVDGRLFRLQGLDRSTPA